MVIIVMFYALLFLISSLIFFSIHLFLWLRCFFYFPFSLFFGCFFLYLCPRTHKSNMFPLSVFPLLCELCHFSSVILSTIILSSDAVVIVVGWKNGLSTFQVSKLAMSVIEINWIPTENYSVGVKGYFLINAKRYLKSKILIYIPGSQKKGLDAKNFECPFCI